MNPFEPAREGPKVADQRGARAEAYRQAEAVVASGVGPGNRHTRRKAAALQRRQSRALKKLDILRGDELPLTGMTQLMILRLAYRALKRGRLTRRQARSLGCCV